MRESKRGTLAGAVFVIVALAASLLVPGFASAGTVTTVTTYEYDATKGVVTAKVQNPDDPNFNLRTQYTYDTSGNRLTASISSTATGTYAIPTRTAARTVYDSWAILPIAHSDAMGHSTGVEYNPAEWLLSSTDPNQLKTSWTYDDYGRVTRGTQPDGNTITVNRYSCASSSPCSPASAAVTAVKIPSNGPPVTTYFDAFNRIVRTATTGFDGNTTIYVDTEYDNFGRVYRTSRPYYSGQMVRWTVYSYDALGRTTSVTAPDGGVVRTDYNGLTTTITNELNQKRSTTVDGRGLPVQVIDDAGNALTYQYDAAGRPTQTTDPKGNTVQAAYDLVGNKTSLKDPDLGTTSYVYNVLGNRLQQTDAKGQITSFQYDLAGRMTKRSEPDLVSTYTYDACSGGINSICSTSADNGYKSVNTYDQYSRLSGVTTTIDKDYTILYTYNDQGRLATIQYPDTFTVQYDYTSLGYLSDVRDPPTGGYTVYWRANRMDAEGHYVEQVYANSVVTQQDFDAATGRMMAIRAGINNSVQNLAYTYDKHGNMLTRSDSNQNLSESFLYDNLNRMTSNTVNSTSAGLITQTYAYDELGNIASRSDVGTYTYGAVNARPHAVSQISRADGSIRQFSYDASGNLVQEVERDASNNVIVSKGRTETWTSFDMPLKLANASTSLQYVYGTGHQRIKEISPDYTTYFVHPDNAGSLLFERDSDSYGNSLDQRIFITAGSAGVVAIRKSGRYKATTFAYLHRDNLGSVTAVTDSSGNVIERMAYEPFGKRRTPAGALDPSGTIKGINTNRGFTDHEELDSVGLIHMNARIYDPVIGRFLSPDTLIQSLGELQSFNRYSYVLNNPLRYVDPTGHETAVVPVVGSRAQALFLQMEFFDLYNFITGMAGKAAGLAGAASRYVPVVAGAALLVTSGNGPKADQCQAVTTCTDPNTGEKLELGADGKMHPIRSDSNNVPEDTNSKKPADTKGTPDDPNNPDPNEKDDKAKVLQTGSNTIDKRTANGLNEHFDQNLNRREWGKALEELKKENGLRNDFHGRIMSNGDYVSPQGSVIDNIGGYIK